MRIAWLSIFIFNSSTWHGPCHSYTYSLYLWNRLIFVKQFCVFIRCTGPSWVSRWFWIVLPIFQSFKITVLFLHEFKDVSKSRRVVAPAARLKICFSGEQKWSQQNPDFIYFSLHKAPPPTIPAFCFYSNTATSVLPIGGNFPIERGGADLGALYGIPLIFLPSNKASFSPLLYPVNHWHSVWT